MDNDTQENIADYGALLTQLYNAWRYELLDRTRFLRQGEIEKIRDPKATLQSQNGHQFSIIDVVEARKNSVREAKQCVEAIEAMIEAHSRGKLEECWSEEQLKPLGISVDNIIK
jgi:hypothetical protein